MLDAVSGEYTCMPVIHLNREVDGQLALGMLEDFVETRIETKMPGAYLQLLKGVLVRVAALFLRSLANPVHRIWHAIDSSLNRPA
jgi:hypothetical protein